MSKLTKGKELRNIEIALSILKQEILDIENSLRAIRSNIFHLTMEVRKIRKLEKMMEEK